VFRNGRVHTHIGGNILTVASDQAELKILRPPNFEAVHPAAVSAWNWPSAKLRNPDPASGIVLTMTTIRWSFMMAKNREDFRRNMTWDLRH